MLSTSFSFWDFSFLGGVILWVTHGFKEGKRVCLGLERFLFQEHSSATDPMSFSKATYWTKHLTDPVLLYSAFFLFFIIYSQLRPSTQLTFSIFQYRRNGSVIERGWSFDRLSALQPGPLSGHICLSCGEQSNPKELEKFYSAYHIPRGVYHLYIPQHSDRIFHTPPVSAASGDMAIGISELAFKCGFRVPLLHLIKNYSAK